MISLPLVDHIASFGEEIVSWRHDIHRHPELAYEERRTLAKVADLLRQFGCDEVVEGLGQTGVVGVIRQGDGPMVGLRADMDALPIEEVALRPYRSVHRGKMHACGHDGHTAMGLAAARYLAETRRFQGSVVMVFQPAEEGAGGAMAMMEDGLWERFPMQAIYGMHNIPGLAAGSMAVSSGPVMAATDEFSVLIQGQGGMRLPLICAVIPSSPERRWSGRCKPWYRGIVRRQRRW